MNAPTSSWQQIRDSAKTSIRKSIVLPSLDTKKHFSPFQCKGISTNYAIATIGYHKVVQRHLMNLSDECLLKAFDRTPELTSDEDFCGVWNNIDLSTDAFPMLTGVNVAHRIQSKLRRDGKLIKTLRFTPLFTQEARQSVSSRIIKRKRPAQIVFTDDEAKEPKKRK